MRKTKQNKRQGKANSPRETIIPFESLSSIQSQPTKEQFIGFDSKLTELNKWNKPRLRSSQLNDLPINTHFDLTTLVLILITCRNIFE